MGMILTNGPTYRPPPGAREKDYVPTYHPSYRPPLDERQTVRLADSPAFQKPQPSPIADLSPRAGASGRSRRKQQFVTSAMKSLPRADSVPSRIVALMAMGHREYGVSELAGRLGVISSTVASTLARLVHQWKIKRRQDPATPRLKLYRVPSVKIEGV